MIKLAGAATIALASFGAYAEGSDVVYETFTALEVNKLYNSVTIVRMQDLTDGVAREAKIVACAAEYIKKESNTYAKIAQHNLYDLIHNFERIASKIQGKKLGNKDVSYKEKIEALARVQCEAYYSIGVLKR